MNRRRVLKLAGAVPLLSVLGHDPVGAAPCRTLRRVRPSDPEWPNDALWQALNRRVGGRLFVPRSPLAACAGAPDDQPCREVLANLHNPYFLGDEPALTESSGWAGAPQEAIAAAAAAATNPHVLTAFALAILGAAGPPAFAGMPGPVPDLEKAREDAAAIGKAMGELHRLAPGTGSYVSESDFFEADWQRAFWGRNYPRLQAVKAKYDPDGLFFVHHGVGSEDWSADGFTRL